MKLTNYSVLSSPVPSVYLRLLFLDVSRLLTFLTLNLHGVCSGRNSSSYNRDC